MDMGKFFIEMRMISIIQRINKSSFYDLYYVQRIPVPQIWDEVLSPCGILLPDCVYCLSTDYNN